MHTFRHRQPGRRRAFTLIELIAVMVIVAIAAASAGPVLGRVDRVKRAHARDEIERRLLMARAHAMATGMPSGVRFDVDTQMARCMEILSAGAAPTVMRVQNHDEALDSMFAGAGLTDVSVDAGGVFDTLWFTIDGTPHYRTVGGVYVGGATQDSVITVTGGGTVTVRMISGLIE